VVVVEQVLLVTDKVVALVVAVVVIMIMELRLAEEVN
jgi:hypothetical protein